MKKYDVSAPFSQSLARFAKNCSLETKFDMVPGSVDEKAFGEFRVLMSAIRMSQRATPATLAQK
jgi:hypothetical protein